MIVVDANLLLYAHDTNSPQHGKARQWVERVFSGSAPVGLTWQTVLAFLRVVANPRLPGQGRTSDEAARVVNHWLDQPNIRFAGA